MAAVTAYGGGLRGRALLAAVDLGWAAGCLWLAVALLGGDGWRAVPAVAALYPLGLLLGLLLGRLRLRRLFLLAARVVLSLPLLLLGLWLALYAPRPLFDGAWLGALLGDVVNLPWALSVPPLLLLTGGLALWRGLWSAEREATHRTAGVSFQVGLVVLAMAAALAGAGLAPFALGWALAFLAVGLLALALKRGDEAGIRRDPGARLWALLFTALLLGGALALALYGDGLALALIDLGRRTLQAIGDALGALLSWLASLAGPPEPVELPPEATAPRVPQRSPIADLLTVPEPVRRVGGFMILFGFLVPLAVALFRYLGELWRWLTDPLFMSGVRVEGLSGEGGAGLGGRLRGLAYRLAKLLWRVSGGRSMDGDPRGWAVRLAYRDLLKKGSKRGAARPTSATAAEHLATLSRAFPGEEEGLRAITAAYERARYGPAPEPSEVGPVRNLVRQVTRRRWFERKKAKLPDSP